MLDTSSALLWLTVFSVGFALAGFIYTRRHSDRLDDFLVARNTQNSLATIYTLIATTMGTWILFGPAESATWGGVSAILGYALGVLVPGLMMIPLGERIRKIMPQGHTLTEFVYNRYGRGVYAFVLVIMLLYLFVGLAAGLTGIAQMVAIISPVPLWASASIVMLATLGYTLYGGLRVTIFTDRVQMFIILPFIAMIFWFGWQAAGGIAPSLTGLQEQAPALLDPFDQNGLKTGITFFIAVALTGLFYQGTWQRVFAARDDKALRNAFVLSSLLSFPIIFLLGLFGLAFIGLGLPGEGSLALFNVILDSVPSWFVIGLLLLGLALIMSSADSTISGLNSLLVVDLHRLFPNLEGQQLLKLSRWIIILISMPALLIASQGYSILYLFLLADLFCCAAAFPVFFGFYNAQYQGYNATLSILGGLVAGLFFFPLPGDPAPYLMESFLLATLVPVAISFLLMLLPKKAMFDFGTIANNVKEIMR